VLGHRKFWTDTVVPNAQYNDPDDLIPNHLNVALTGLALSPRGIVGKPSHHGTSKNLLSCCLTCHNHLKVNEPTTPFYAIANNNFIGCAPSVLTELTEVELALIQPVLKHGHCFTYIYFQLLFPPRRHEWVLLNFLWRFILYLFWNVSAGPFFPAVMCYVISHQGRVPAGQLCDLQTGPMHVSSRTAIYGWSTVVDDATALRWSHEDCSTRAHSFNASHYTKSD